MNCSLKLIEGGVIFVERNLSSVYTTYRGHLSTVVLFARQISSCLAVSTLTDELRVCGRLLCLLKVGTYSVCEGISCKLYNVKHSASLIIDENEPAK